MKHQIIIKENGGIFKKKNMDLKKTKRLLIVKFVIKKCFKQMEKLVNLEVF